MPFDPNNPPAKVKGLPAKKQKQWVEVFNSCWEKNKDDKKCHMIAWGVVKKAHQMEVISRISRIAGRLDLEKQIFDVVDKETSEGMARIIVPWITIGLIGNDFIAIGLDDVKFKYVDNDKMDFYAEIHIEMADVDKSFWKVYRWRKRGKGYKGIIQISHVMSRDLFSDIRYF